MPGLFDLLRGGGPQIMQQPRGLPQSLDPYSPEGMGNPQAMAALFQSMQAPQQAPQQQPMPQGQSMPQPAPQQAQAGYQQPQGGGFGQMIGNLLNPGQSGRNQTEAWLQSQGLDQGTARIVASDKGLLQRYIMDRRKGTDPKDALQAEKLQLEINEMRNPKEPTTDDVREYQFAKKEGYKGTFAEWRKGEGSKPSAVQEYEYAKGQGFPGTFQDWEASKKGGMSLQVDPTTGAVTFQQGGNIKPMTEAQSKDTVYSTRAAGALPLIDKFGDALTSLPEALGGALPGVGNYMKSPEFQQGEQAGREFLQAILRKDTGAAITSQEMTEYGTVYLPKPGDSPEVLAQKKTSRQRALAAIEAGMPPQGILAREKALATEGQGAPSSAAPRAHNPQTGQILEWNGSAWVPAR